MRTLWVLVMIGMVSASMGRPPKMEAKRVHKNVKLSWKRMTTPRWYAIENADNDKYWNHVNPKRILIRLKKGLNEHSPQIASLLKEFNADKVVSRSYYPDKMNFIVVELPSSSKDYALSFIEAARDIPGILYAEPEVIRSIRTCDPNDPLYWDPSQNAYQWGYVSIGADSAWCYTTGSHDVVVAVIDAGMMYDHPDISPNYIGGYDFLDNDDDPYPTDGITHGTHVGGTIAAVLNNNLGVAGFGNFGLVSLRVCGQQGCPSSAIVNAILTVAFTDWIQLANMSLGGPVPSQAEYDACDSAWAYGKLLIAASGNESNDSVGYPAGFPQVVAVGSFAWDGGNAGNYFYIAPYSNYGPSYGGDAPYGIELMGPGGDMDTYTYMLGVLSTSFDNSMNPVYEYMQGTSMASPHVTGLAALVLSMATQNGVTLSNSELREILDDNAFDNALYIPQLGGNDPVGYDQYTGFGAINAVGSVLDPRVGVSENESFYPSQQLPEFTTEYRDSKVKIHFAAPLEKTANVEIVDIGGRVLLNTSFAPGKVSYYIPFTRNGVYFVRVAIEGTSVTRKVVCLE